MRPRAAGGHYRYGPLWAAVGLFGGPVGAGVAPVKAGWSGFFQKAAAKANGKKKCMALGAGGTRYGPGVAYGGPYLHPSLLTPVRPRATGSP
ncbi:MULTISPECIES: hypothetical protein [unclassified Streptomyces]|uniref:hypothetical protein n=1 Tax=unclassified Streptomyces TaxID=2593676 RepID=UPI00381DC379